MALLYLTADEIGTPTGGGTVTAQESLALRELSAQLTRDTRNPFYSSVETYSRANLNSEQAEPWKWDNVADLRVQNTTSYRLCHIYSSTFGKTVKRLKEEHNCKTVYTIAAHDRVISKLEHEKLGMPFPYKHLTDETEWQKYIEGYRLADVIVCPGKVAADIVRNYGRDFLHKDIRIIPHGCHYPGTVKPLPKQFVVGYMGSFGADKGVKYLLEAWKKLAYNDGSILVLAGRDSTTAWGKHLLNTYGGGSVYLAGWQRDVGDFYNSIGCFVCPAATEGFNMEVLEAMSYGRAVLCSENAGASDLVPGCTFPACNANTLADRIDALKKDRTCLEASGAVNREQAKDYTWEKIRQQYKQLWTEVLGL